MKLPIKKLVMALASAYSVLAIAAVTFDNSAVVSAGARGTSLSGNMDIPAASGTQVGGNLFHSFRSFSVSTGESAMFSGPGSVTNILARVTGGTASSIDGRLGTSIQGANLYLMNPSGIVFGANASLDLTGSFHATTADSIKLGTGGVFYANELSSSVLTVDAPTAFGFIATHPASITFDGTNLTVADGQSINIIGGDITATDTSLLAPSGSIQLVAVGSPGTVTNDGNGGWNQFSGFTQFGDISFSTTANYPFSNFQCGGLCDPVDPATGYPPNAFAVAANIDVSSYNNFGPAGKIFLKGRNFSLDAAYVYADAYFIGDSGSVRVDMENDIHLTNGASITTLNVTYITPNSVAGNIFLSGTNVLIDNGAQCALITEAAQVPEVTFALTQAGHFK